MVRTKRMVLSAVLLSTLFASPAAETAPELTALAAHLARTSEVSAHFTQRRTLSALKDVLVSEGTFSWRRGGKLDWHVQTPTESEILLDYKTAVMRYPALQMEQAIDLSSQPQLAAVFQSILAVLRADLERLKPQYELSVQKKSPLWLDLKPKSAEVASVVEKIHLRFDERMDLARVTLDEAGGDTTDIAFQGHVKQVSRR